MIRNLVYPLLSGALLAVFGGVQAGEVRLAVAANFTAAMAEIVAGFEAQGKHQAIVSYGSTGKLYTQILYGAPYDVFLAADQDRPLRLEREGVATDRFTYAVGKLVLWTRKEGQSLSDASLKQGSVRRLAIANPKTAPYGAAAVTALDRLGVLQSLGPKLIRGDSIAQTYQFVATGNAELGLIALAQVAIDSSGSQWLLPEDLYPPIRQDAVLLDRGRDNPAARDFMEYLRSEGAQAVIRRYGYGSH